MMEQVRLCIARRGLILQALVQGHKIGVLNLKNYTVVEGIRYNECNISGWGL